MFNISTRSFRGKLMLLFLVLLLKAHRPQTCTTTHHRRDARRHRQGYNIYMSPRVNRQHQSALSPHSASWTLLCSDMSPCCRSLSLLVLLGAAMAFGGLVQSQELIENLLRLKEVEVGEKPLFSSVIRSINTMCQTDVQLLNATLDVYTRTFSSILQHGHQRHRGHGPALLNKLSSSDRNVVRSELRKQQQQLEDLRARLGQLNPNTEVMIQQLNEIKVDAPLYQRKALAEFKLVYVALSEVASHCSTPLH